MRKIVYIIAALATFALGSCINDGVNTGNGNEGMKEFTFKVNIPDAKELSRAAWEGNDLTINQIIDNMYILVFDENGFMSRHKAEQGSAPNEFKIMLEATDKHRVLHFIANYDWTGFDDEQLLNLSEAMLVGQMTASYPRVVYWQRADLPTGVSVATFPSPVTLNRNVAKISVVNGSVAATLTYPDVDSFFSNVQYVIGNYYNMGTVAPFNTVTGQFDTNALLEAPGATITGAAAADFLPAFDGSLAAPGGVSAFTYERAKLEPGDPDRTYIILKANYHTDVGDVTGTERFYKIDISIPGEAELYDIWRNRNYVITIGRAIHWGYDTFDDAVNGLSLNNFATAMEQSYNSISDGASILNIEYVNRTFVQAGANFAIRYSYIDGSTGATDNTGVQGVVTHTAVPAIDLPDGNLTPGGPNLPNQKVGTGDYVDRVNGNMVSTLPGAGVTAQSSIKISKNGLSRIIILKLREPWTFEPCSMDPSTVASSANQPVDINITIPADLQDYLPFYVYVDGATMLMPVQGSGIYFEDLGTSYRYRYQVTTTGTHTLHFKTGSTTGSGTITVRSDLFRDETFVLTRN